MVWPDSVGWEVCEVIYRYTPEGTIDASVPEFANQYQYQYQYQKKYSVQYETSTSTAQILSVPVPVSVQQILTKNAAKFEIFEWKISFLCGKFKFRGAILNFRVWNWNLKRKIWHILEKFMAANFFCLIFAVFFVLVLVLIDSVLARSVPVQSQYLKTGPVPVPVHQYQKWSVDWKNQYQYQWTDASILCTQKVDGSNPLAVWYFCSRSWGLFH